jgi:hypothetical protein
VLPLHSSMVLPLGTSRGFLSTACWTRITLAITRPPEGWDVDPNLLAAALVHGCVSCSAPSPEAMALLEVGPPH